MPFRRRMRRSSGPRPVIQSFKKVLNFAPISQSAGSTITRVLVDGTDSVAAGQTGVTDSDVPTGAIIKYIEIQWAVNNLVNTSCFMNMTIQLLHSGQFAISPLVVGGNPQRNQVYHQQLFSIGQSQNSNHIYRFKVPKRVQRVREGDLWVFAHNGSAIHTDSMQVIYKFYR